MPAKKKSSRARVSRRRRLGFALGTVSLFAVALYFGVELAQSPKAPDLSRLTAVEPPAKGLEEGSSQSSPPAPAAAAAASLAAPPQAPLEVVRQPPPAAAERPRIALVIDDLGRSLRDVEALAALDIDITYAVLPFETRTREVVADLSGRGVEYICHMPMQPRGGANPGPGALTLAMSPAELRQAARQALAAVPGARGVNNHMGSSISAERQAISQVLAVVSEAGLYYLDSRTSADTLGYSVARQLGVPAGERQVFLDTERDPRFIEQQFERLLRLARQRGGVIAIAHPYRETLEILAREVPRARAAGLEFVRLSELLDSGGVS